MHVGSLFHFLFSMRYCSVWFVPHISLVVSFEVSLALWWSACVPGVCPKLLKSYVRKGFEKAILHYVAGLFFTRRRRGAESVDKQVVFGLTTGMFEWRVIVTTNRVKPLYLVEYGYWTELHSAGGCRRWNWLRYCSGQNDGGGDELYRLCHYTLSVSRQLAVSIQIRPKKVVRNPYTPTGESCCPFVSSEMFFFAIQTIKWAVFSRVKRRDRWRFSFHLIFWGDSNTSTQYIIPICVVRRRGVGGCAGARRGGLCLPYTRDLQHTGVPLRLS